MYILGLNAFHGDSSACLLKDGVLIGAVEEERFLRIKHWAGFPSESIRWCLLEAGISLEDVHHVALNQDTKANGEDSFLELHIYISIALRKGLTSILVPRKKKFFNPDLLIFFNKSS